MQKNKRRCILKNNLWITAFFMNLIAFICSQVFFQPMFETCDDNYMAAIAYGAYGEYESRIVCIHEFIGKLLKGLLTIFPSVPWYSVIQYVCLFAAFTAILFIFLSNEKNEYRYIMSWIFLITFGYECYVKIQFSKTAGVLTIAGILLLYEALRTKRIHFPSLIFGAVLSILGSLWRFNVFCMVLPIIGSIGVFIAVRYLKEKSYKDLIRFSSVFIVLFLICFGLKFYDIRVYESNEEWNDYITFEKARVQLLDYGFPNYDENIQTYQELGISQNDLRLYRYWNYGDPDLFTIDRINALTDTKDKTVFSFNVVKEFFSQFPVRFLSYPYFTMFLLILTVWIISGKRNLGTVLFAMLAALCIEIYFFYAGRYFISRIDVSVFLGLCVVLILQTEISRFKCFNKYLVGALMGGLLLNTMSFLNNTELPKSTKSIEQAQEVYNLIHEDKGHFYAMENYTSDDLWTTAYSVWDMPPKGLNSNCYIVGGWRYNSPLSNKVKESYGVRNVYSDIVDNPNAYLMNDKSIDSMLTYIQDHYYPSAKAVLAKKINGHKVFKIVTKMPNINTNKALEFTEDIIYNASIKRAEDGNPILQGMVYKEGSNSYYQEVYVGICDKETGKEELYLTCSTEKSSTAERASKYSWFEIPVKELKIDTNLYDVQIKLYLKIDGQLYGTILELN